MKAILLRTHERSLHLLFRFVLSLFLITPSLFLKAQCIASSTLSTTTATNDNLVGTIDFLLPGAANASDNNSSFATAPVALFTGSSHYLKLTGFNFSIPPFSTICGVVVEIEKKAGGLAILAWIRDNQVKLVKGNTITGNNLGNTGADWSGTDAYYTHGSATNLWGTTLTAADVNSANFGVAISAKFNGLIGVFPSAQIDHVRMTIYYNPILPVHIISFNASLKNNTALLKWKTADEEINDIVTLQRTTTGSTQWVDITKFETSINNNGNDYSYADALTITGNYSYRLKISNSISNSIYSEIKNIQYAEKNSIKVYPNPSSDYIIINTKGNIQSLIISNIFQQKIITPSLQIIGTNTAKVDISHLAKGIYVVAVGNEYIKFLKE